MIIRAVKNTTVPEIIDCEVRIKRQLPSLYRFIGGVGNRKLSFHSRVPPSDNIEACFVTECNPNSLWTQLKLLRCRRIITEERVSEVNGLTGSDLIIPTAVFDNVIFTLIVINRSVPQTADLALGVILERPVQNRIVARVCYLDFHRLTVIPFVQNGIFHIVSIVRICGCARFGKCGHLRQHGCRRCRGY